MKAAQRVPWLELTEIILPLIRESTEDIIYCNWCSLCHFCRYAQWEGYCKESYPVCQHPLAERYEFDAFEGDGNPCWGFRPKVSWDTACRMVENWLLGKDVILPDELLLGRKHAISQ